MNNPNNLKKGIGYVYPNTFDSLDSQKDRNIAIDSDSNPIFSFEVSNERKLTKKLNYLYEFYPGRNRFFCNGKCVAGPISDVAPFCCGWILMVGVSLFYGVFIAPELWLGELQIFPILSIIFFIFTMVFLILCNCTDPGIIPRRYIFEVQGYVPKEFLNCSSIEDKEDFRKIFKFCETCQIYRPPKSSHCKLIKLNKKYYDILLLGNAIIV